MLALTTGEGVTALLLGVAGAVVAMIVVAFRRRSSAGGRPRTGPLGCIHGPNGDRGAALVHRLPAGAVAALSLAGCAGPHAPPGDAGGTVRGDQEREDGGYHCPDFRGLEGQESCQL